MQYSTSTEYSGFRSVSHVGYRTLWTSAPPHHASYHTIPYHTIPSMHHSMHHTIHASYHTIPYHTIPYHACMITMHRTIHASYQCHTTYHAMNLTIHASYGASYTPVVHAGRVKMHMVFSMELQQKNRTHYIWST